MPLPLAKIIRKFHVLWITIPSVAGLIVLLRVAGALQSLEWMAFDQYVRLRPQEATDDRVIIVGVNENDIRQLKRYPFDDATFAKLLTKIKQQQPRAIGLDIYRDLPVEPGHSELAKVFQTTPNLIGIEKRGGSTEVEVAPPPILKQRNQTASNDVVLDGDGKLRRGLLYWTSPNGEESLESLGLRLAMLYLEAQGITSQPAKTNSQYLQLGHGIFPIFEPSDGSYVSADAGGYQILLNYRGASGKFRTVSLMDVLQDRLPADLMRDSQGQPFRGKIVLIGVTARSLKDVFYTPYSGDSITTPERMAGVEVQANLASQIISAAIDGRSGFQVWTDAMEAVWILLWSGVGTGLGWMVRSPRWAVAGTVVAVGGLGLGSFAAFVFSWWIPVVPPALALLTSAMVVTVHIAHSERRDRQTVMNLFGRYVTPTIAETIWRDRDQLLSQGRLRGQKLTATVLFTDIKNFSTIAERFDPETLMIWLNEYMEAMTEVVLKHGAVVDKFIGDAIMAVFGVPIARKTSKDIAHDAYSAVQCAIEMSAALAALNQRWAQQGHPTIQMRVGISTGTVVTGSLGGQQRMDYTAIGDSVNVAARLESFDKSIEGGLCRILISEETFTLVEGQFPVQAVGTVQLKGREQPTNVYQVLWEPSKSERGRV
ncbi:MAG: adenylate/guanylate cyclase domain-containing protein [Leptolyngbya sp. UWPOB_LEPTO1]|uniref:CHASE2 domain-containing protein n=1 Tax=Leptolyngbya sp. UWPOB_LEPTO1 TaxID=2815653 RepID=UPI001AD384B4|nr:adenylate/guanylate cyclase domain-containing protein [Leptolyngbya sp. UWPOB_LEPTO1]MBN8560321.1 adenylate/guanylate cyclase domain-containing protein [Leptolyngbya sp. UWPOB_LEPTO1]